MRLLVRKRAKPPRAVGACLWDAIEGAAGAGWGSSGAGPAGPLPGLSLVHIRPVTGTFEARQAVGGSVVQVKRIIGKKPKNKALTASKRGVVKGLSPAAGGRLRRKLLSIDKGRVESA